MNPLPVGTKVQVLALWSVFYGQLGTVVEHMTGRQDHGVSFGDDGPVLWFGRAELREVEG